MNLIRIILIALTLTAQGCALFQKNPDLRSEIKRVKTNVILLRKAYEPLVNEKGKVIGKPAYRPFGDDEKLNKKGQENGIGLCNETLKLLKDMDAAYLDKKAKTEAKP